MGGLALKIPVVTDKLSGLIETANECIEPDLLKDFADVDLTDSDEYWKFALIIAIVVKFVYNLLPDLLLKSKLQNSQAIEQEFSKMPTEVKDFISKEEVDKSVKYNLGLKKFDIAAWCLDLVFEVLVVLFDVIPLVWYSWIVVAHKMDIC